MTQHQPVVLRCDECRLPVARIVGNRLVIVVKHHGRTHTTAISLAQLQRLIEEHCEQAVA